MQTCWPENEVACISASILQDLKRLSKGPGRPKKKESGGKGEEAAN
jgi:hypothetical protein